MTDDHRRFVAVAQHRAQHRGLLAACTDHGLPDRLTPFADADRTDRASSALPETLT